MKRIIYLSYDRIIELNILVLNLIKVKKADKAEVLSQTKINSIINECKELDRDVYDKAVFLLKSFIQKHPFASGNRRTAFVVAKEFLMKNKKKIKIKDKPEQAKIMVGIRENYYTDQELKEWIKNGKIKEFKR